MERPELDQLKAVIKECWTAHDSLLFTPPAIDKPADIGDALRGASGAHSVLLLALLLRQFGPAIGLSADEMLELLLGTLPETAKLPPDDPILTGDYSFHEAPGNAIVILRADETSVDPLVRVDMQRILNSGPVRQAILSARQQQLVQRAVRQQREAEMAELSKDLGASPAPGN